MYSSETLDIQGHGVLVGGVSGIDFKEGNDLLTGYVLTSGKTGGNRGALVSEPQHVCFLINSQMILLDASNPFLAAFLMVSSNGVGWSRSG